MAANYNTAVVALKAPSPTEKTHCRRRTPTASQGGFGQAEAHFHHHRQPNATPPPRIWQPSAAKKGADAEKGDPRGSKEHPRGPSSFHKGALRASISTGKNCVNLTRSEKIKKQRKREIAVF